LVGLSPGIDVTQLLLFIFDKVMDGTWNLSKEKKWIGLTIISPTIHLPEEESNQEFDALNRSANLTPLVCEYFSFQFDSKV
jgi:hypothetical protein